jgi:hypothetical protein
MSGGIYNKYTGHHHRRSIRLKGYDYSRPGAYFVTICIHDRAQRLFGNVVDGKMVLNDAGPPPRIPPRVAVPLTRTVHCECGENYIMEAQGTDGAVSLWNEDSGSRLPNREAGPYYFSKR